MHCPIVYYKYTRIHSTLDTRKQEQEGYIQLSRIYKKL